MNILEFLSDNLSYITIIIVFIVTYIAKPSKKWFDKKMSERIENALSENKKINSISAIEDSLSKICARQEEHGKIIDNINKLNDDLNVHIEIQKNQLKVQLCDTLLESINKGYATMEERELAKDLYEGYEICHGNGVVANLWEQYLDLPLSPEEE